MVQGARMTGTGGKTLGVWGLGYEFHELPKPVLYVCASELAVWKVSCHLCSDATSLQKGSAWLWEKLTCTPGPVVSERMWCFKESSHQVKSARSCSRYRGLALSCTSTGKMLGSFSHVMCSEVVCGGSSSYSMVWGPTDSPRLSMELKGQSCFPKTVLKRFTALAELAKVLRSAHRSELGHWTVLVITPPHIHIENKHLFQ